MPKRITKLTIEQEARMSEWRDKWIAIGLKTGDVDFETLSQWMGNIYAKRHSV